MNKTIYRLMGILVTVAIALGSFYSVRASTEASANQIYYISPAGSDNNDCSLNSPCATVEAVPAQPGDTIILQAGLYTGNMAISLKGAPEAPIIISGNGAVLDGGSVTLTDSEWLIFENLTSINATNSFDVKTSHYIAWRNNVFDFITRGLYIREYSSHLLIENNEFYQSCSFGKTWEELKDSSCEGSAVHGAALGGGTYHIRNNYVHDAFNGFIFTNGGTEKWVNANVYIYNNRFKNILDDPVKPEGDSFNFHIFDSSVAPVWVMPPGYPNQIPANVAGWLDSMSSASSTTATPSTTTVSPTATETSQPATPSPTPTVEVTNEPATETPVPVTPTVTATPIATQGGGITVSTDGLSLPDAIAQANNGDTIYIEAGEYDLNGYAVTIDKSISLIGEDGAVLTNGRYFAVDTDNLHVENIEFRDWRKNYQDAAFRLLNADGLTIQNCVFENVPTGVYATAAGTFKNISIRDNEFVNINSPYHVAAIRINEGAVSNLIIQGNTLENIFSTVATRNVFGIYLGTNAVDVQNVLIEDNVIHKLRGGTEGVDPGFDNASGRAILVYGDNIRVINNDIRDIDKADAPRNCIYLKADNSIIDGNTLHNCGSTRTGSGDLTIKGSSDANNIISNNVITSTHNSAIGIFNKTSATIEGNQISGVKWGMFLYSDQNNDIVTTQIVRNNDVHATNIAMWTWEKDTRGDAYNNVFLAPEPMRITAPNFEEHDNCTDVSCAGNVPTETATPVTPTPTPIVEVTK